MSRVTQLKLFCSFDALPFISVPFLLFCMWLWTFGFLSICFCVDDFGVVPVLFVLVLPFHVWRSFPLWRYDSLPLIFVSFHDVNCRPSTERSNFQALFSFLYDHIPIHLSNYRLILLFYNWTIISVFRVNLSNLNMLRLGYNSCFSSE